MSNGQLVPGSSNLPVTGNGNGPIIHMGLGLIGDGHTIFKRKFRWTIELYSCPANSALPVSSTNANIHVPKDFVKVGSRPNIDIEETEINYLNAKMWIPGKATWQTMTVTYYDVGGSGPAGVGTGQLYAWLASVYNFTDPINLTMGTALAEYEGIADIFLYDGCGNALEGWELQHVWPQAINFGELDMSSSEEVTVELTLRYSQVYYANYCGTVTTPCSCASCP